METKTMVSALRCVAFIAILLSSSITTAQEQPKKPIQTELHQQVPKELEAAFAERMEASRANDPEKIKRLLAPDFSIKLPNGKVLTRNEVEALSKPSGGANGQNGEQTFVIEKLKIQGDSAILQVQYTHTYKRRLKDGTTGEITVGGPRRETWVKTADGWKLRLIDKIDVGKQFVMLNGKKVDSLAAIPVEPATTPAAGRANSFGLPKGKALVFIYRLKVNPISWVELPVYCDEAEIASVSQGRYIKVMLNPGSYKIRSDRQPAITIDVKDGHIYYFELKIEAGFPRGRGRLVPVDERVGAPVLNVPKLMGLEPLDPSNIKDPAKVMIENGRGN